MMQMVEVLVGGIAAIVGLTMVATRLLDLWQSRRKEKESNGF